MLRNRTESQRSTYLISGSVPAEHGGTRYWQARVQLTQERAAKYRADGFVVAGPIGQA